MDDEQEHRHEAPLVHWNTPLQNLVLERQRELEAELFALLKSTRDTRRAIAAFGEHAGLAHVQEKLEKELARVSDVERTLQVYDRLAQRPWERVKGALSLGAFAISIVALALRFLGHSG
jgi:hypothetical protein